MKTNKNAGKTETFEDIVFEGRNKAYGAYELNKKRRKYLLVAFIITFTGFGSLIAVPFLGTLKAPKTQTVVIETHPVIIKGFKEDKPKVVLPPPPPVNKSIEKIDRTIRYTNPVVVEHADTTAAVFHLGNIEVGTNRPVDVDIDYYPPSTGDVILIEPAETVHLFPSEPATFMHCADLSCFHKWITKNIRYPEEAARENVFGKVVIEFCVSSKGVVEDIKILRSIHPALDEEVIRVVSSSPLWTPAKQGGTPVKQKFTIPCLFEMN